jgi:hypothetical protein
LSGIILLILLALELADRVSMKRDLEIVREIQSRVAPRANRARGAAVRGDGVPTCSL